MAGNVASGGARRILPWCIAMIGVCVFHPAVSAGPVEPEPAVIAGAPPLDVERWLDVEPALDIQRRRAGNDGRLRLDRAGRHGRMENADADHRDAPRQYPPRTTRCDVSSHTRSV